MLILWTSTLPSKTVSSSFLFGDSSVAGAGNMKGWAKLTSLSACSASLDFLVGRPRPRLGPSCWLDLLLLRPLGYIIACPVYCFGCLPKHLVILRELLIFYSSLYAKVSGKSASVAHWGLYGSIFSLSAKRSSSDSWRSPSSSTEMLPESSSSLEYMYLPLPLFVFFFLMLLRVDLILLFCTFGTSPSGPSQFIFMTWHNMTLSEFETLSPGSNFCFSLSFC